MPDFEVDATVYQSGMGDYEYRATLVEKETGKTVDEIDSADQPTVSGMTKDEAERSVQKIRQDVRNGNPEEWFAMSGMFL